MAAPYAILARKRCGESLSAADIHGVVQGATDGSWQDAQLGAFLMAVAIRGLDADETRTLTEEMLASGDRWQLARDLPLLGDKHSTGGVGDKVSLPLAPLLAACGLPVVMLTGRGLGHTGGTADKLEVIPGLDLELDRARALAVLRQTGLAIGVATPGIAPADRKLYALRDVTATVDSLPLITASILSKKLATGAAAVIFDVKVGEAAFLPEVAEARRLAALLVATCRALGVAAAARLTDMSQPLGEWSGNAAEVRETFELLAGGGPADTLAVTFALALDLAHLLGVELGRADLERAIASGAARERFDRWAAAQGADPGWLAAPSLPLAPIERLITAPRAGVLAGIATRQLGMLLIEAGAGRRRAGEAIDPGVALRCRAKLGQRVEAGDELARLYLRRDDADLVRRCAACFTIGETGAAPELIQELIV